MTIQTLADLAMQTTQDPPLWSDGYKIPWNDPGFSRRMLAEHLSQDHDLASRKSEAILLQAQWIHKEVLSETPGRILDLGCGPGLYAPHLTAAGHHYLGLDFGPASIAHAHARYAVPGRCRFLLGDVLELPFAGPHDLVQMLYGEINVFPPADAQHILAKTFDALAPGGTILLEAHTQDAVRALGRGESWFGAPAGLFSDAPHLCLNRNQWFEEQRVARQCFHIIDARTAAVRTMFSTTKAWTRKEYRTLLEEAGFNSIRVLDRWPGGREEFLLLLATRP